MDAKYLSSARKRQESEGAEYLGILLNDDGGAVDEIQLLVHGDGEGIFFEGGRPAVGVGLYGSELHGRGLEGGVGFGNDNRFTRDAGDLVGGDQRRCGESPLAAAR